MYWLSIALSGDRFLDKVSTVYNDVFDAVQFTPEMHMINQIDLQSWLRPALGKSKVLEHLNLKSRPKHLVCKINDL